MGYRVAVTMTQETGDKVDNRTLTEDFSDDPIVHAVKVNVFAEEFAEAGKRITKRLTDMVIAAGGKGNSKPQ